METVFISHAYLRSPPSQVQTLALSPLSDAPYISRRSSSQSIVTSSRFFFIRSAISRKKKEEIVHKVKEQLKKCHLFAGLRYRGFTVKNFEHLRSTLPENTKLMVAKNRLVRIAAQGTPWEAIEPCLKQMNAWLFVYSEDIPAAIKPFRNFQAEYRPNNDFTGAVFEGKFYAPEEIQALEKMPTRSEVYAKLLGSLRSPATALIGTIQAPARDLIFILKARVKKLEEVDVSQ